MNTFRFLLLFCVAFPIANAQDTIPLTKQLKTSQDSAYFEDYMMDGVIILDEVFILPDLLFSDKEELREYLILRRKVRKVWPYAHLASSRLDSLNNRLAKMKTKSQKRKYMKMIQSYVEDEFTDELKKLSRTEGQILVKLMHRQTGETTFDLVKDYRSGWKAFWYNTTANMFSISLKREYNPFEDREDFMIEDILHRSFNKGILQRQPSAEKYDFYELLNLWKNKVDLYNKPTSYEDESKFIRIY
jgi:hypothetical protein